MPKTKTDQPAPPVFALDDRELWAAAARKGMADPITAASIAKAAGVQEATLNRVLAGKRRPPVTLLAALAITFPRSYNRIVRPAKADGTPERRGAPTR